MVATSKLMHWGWRGMHAACSEMQPTWWMEPHVKVGGSGQLGVHACGDDSLKLLNVLRDGRHADKTCAPLHPCSCI